jgi:hypothetical protein
MLTALCRYTDGIRREGRLMTAKLFFDWQTDGGTDDVMRQVVNP